MLKSFETAKECEAAKVTEGEESEKLSTQDSLTIADNGQCLEYPDWSNLYAIRARHLACITTDDPRLKP
jgi:hypothetical protein